MAKHKILIEENIYKVANYWINRLGLTLWDIKVAIVRNSEMPEKNCSGCTTTMTVSRNAFVYLLDVKEHYLCPIDIDMEQVLVHELLHIKWSNVGWQGDEHVMSILEHQLLNDLSVSLVEAHRYGLQEK